MIGSKNYPSLLLHPNDISRPDYFSTNAVTSRHHLGLPFVFNRQPCTAKYPTCLSARDSPKPPASSSLHFQRGYTLKETNDTKKHRQQQGITTSLFPAVYRSVGPSTKYVWTKGTVEEKPLGSGYTSTVYRALDTTTGEAVAVKLVPKQKQRLLATDTYYRRLYRWMPLHMHPNVLRLRDFYEDSHHWYIVSDLYTGPDLVDYVLSFPPRSIPIECVKRIIFQLLLGLNHLHTCGLLHRDIKLDNVLFANETKRDVIIVDFDMSFFYTFPELPRPPKFLNEVSVVGTKDYMAPEGYSGIYSEASDLWSVGVILYILLDGHFPFDLAESTNPREIREVLRNGVTIVPEITREHPDAVDLLNKLLVYDSRHRLGHAKEALSHRWFSDKVSDLSIISAPCAPRLQQQQLKCEVQNEKGQGVTSNAKSTGRRCLPVNPFSTSKGFKKSQQQQKPTNDAQKHKHQQQSALPVGLSIPLLESLADKRTESCTTPVQKDVLRRQILVDSLRKVSSLSTMSTTSGQKSHLGTAAGLTSLVSTARPALLQQQPHCIMKTKNKELQKQAMTTQLIPNFNLMLYSRSNNSLEKHNKVVPNSSLLQPSPRTTETSTRDELSSMSNNPKNSSELGPSFLFAAPQQQNASSSSTKLQYKCSRENDFGVTQQGFPVNIPRVSLINGRGFNTNKNEAKKSGLMFWPATARYACTSSSKSPLPSSP